MNKQERMNEIEKYVNDNKDAGLKSFIDTMDAIEPEIQKFKKEYDKRYE